MQPRADAHEIAPRPRILVVDDDPCVVEMLVEALGARYAVEGLVSPHAALERVTTEEFDILISDLEMPEMRGVDLLAAIHARRPTQIVLVITAFGSIELAVNTMRAGACDFVTKPFRPEAMILAIERALGQRTMRREIIRLRRELDRDPGELVARSAAMRHVLDVATRASRSSTSVLLTGESGSGKGAVAQWIHEHSRRASGPFLQVNCATLPSVMIEAELFGARRGAITDANGARHGLFAEASGGTIFLDEIAEMPLDAQSRLLHVLEASQVRPVGATFDVTTDTRVIAATNRPILDAVQRGQFRRDLFFRLNVIPIEVPPLRERSDDIPDLVHKVLARIESGREAPVGISEQAMQWLCQYHWPGNVRQLANVVERAAALTDHDTIVVEDVCGTDVTSTSAAPDVLAELAARSLPLEQVEAAYIKHVLAQNGGNVSQTARILRIDRRTLHRRLSDR